MSIESDLDFYTNYVQLGYSEGGLPFIISSSLTHEINLGCIELQVPKKSLIQLKTIMLTSMNNKNPTRALAEDGQLIQYSVYMTRDQRAAKAMRDLVKHYDGQVMMFKGEQVDL